MLQIKKTQMSAMLDSSLPRFVPRLAAYLREYHDEATSHLNDDLLLERTLIGLRRARSWGFETPFGLSLFVALMFEIAPDFDTHPKIRALLTDNSMPLDGRLAAIENMLSEEEWEALAGPGGAAARSW